MLWVILYALVLAAVVPCGVAQTIAVAIFCGVPIACLLYLQRKHREK